MTYLTKTNRILEILDTISDLNVGICIDNFGYGTSSLTNLSQFPFESLKIDTSLVHSMVISSKMMSMVKSVIEIAHVLKINTIAQGIETESQLNSLKNLNCHYGQGYLFAHPQPLEKLDKFLIKKD